LNADHKPLHATKGRCPLKRLHRHGTHLSSREAPGQAEEVLVTDARAALTTADLVERKLQYLLRGASVAGSHVRMGGPRVRGCANGSS
jgi:hypothetical protein